MLCSLSHLNRQHVDAHDSAHRMESLRLFPPVQMTIRQAGKSEYIDGHWVPKGTWLLTPVKRQVHCLSCIYDSDTCIPRYLLSTRTRLIGVKMLRSRFCYYTELLNDLTLIRNVMNKRFRPERWMSLPKTKNANFFQTFSVGPHHCIGKTMGISEMKAMVAYV